MSAFAQKIHASRLARWAAASPVNALFFLIVAVLSAMIGIGIVLLGLGVITPSKDNIRTVLYERCVNGATYRPDAALGDLGCNRRSIDFMLATIYGDSWIEPMPSARKQYEARLLYLKREQR
jgi:hypothetical protein